MADMIFDGQPQMRERRFHIPPFYGVYLFLLVFINIRYSGVAPYLVVAAGIAVYEAFRVVVLRKRLIFTRVDVAFAAYIVLVFLSFIITEVQPTAMSILVKTISYYVMFFGLRQAIAHDPNAASNLILIAKLSLTVTTAFIVFLMYYSGVKIGDLLSFSYYKVTFKIFQAMTDVLGSDPLARGIDVRRNTISEIIVLFYMLLFGHHAFRHQVLALFLIFLFQSRRAALVIAIFISLRLRNKNSLLLVGIVTGLVLLVWITFAVSGIEFSAFSNRLFSTDVSRRGAQFAETLNLIIDKAALGHGYGAQIDGHYVHNFILSNLYMMGIPGMIVALYFVGALFAELFSSGRERLLILIPLASLAVAGTIEGLLTMSSWACVAIVQGLRMGAQNRQG